jgi:hypothetical protein
MVLPLTGGERKPVPLLNSKFAEAQGSFSPDGRWFAYDSSESGRLEVYVQPFNPPGSSAAPAAGKWQISRDGGSRPKWRSDGKEIVFRALNGTPVAVDITASSAFQVGIPKPLFTMPPNAGAWDLTSDGKRFLIALPEQSGQRTANDPITVVLNRGGGAKN